jgi:hypothetical protein
MNCFTKSLRINNITIKVGTYDFSIAINMRGEEFVFPQLLNI